MDRVTSFAASIYQSKKGHLSIQEGHLLHQHAQIAQPAQSAQTKGHAMAGGLACRRSVLTISKPDEIDVDELPSRRDHDVMGRDWVPQLAVQF
jgi:hypothetical protein